LNHDTTAIEARAALVATTAALEATNAALEATTAANANWRVTSIVSAVSVTVVVGRKISSLAMGAAGLHGAPWRNMPPTSSNQVSSTLPLTTWKQGLNHSETLGLVDCHTTRALVRAGSTQRVGTETRIVNLHLRTTGMMLQMHCMHFISVPVVKTELAAASPIVTQYSGTASAEACHYATRWAWEHLLSICFNRLFELEVSRREFFIKVQGVSCLVIKVYICNLEVFFCNLGINLRSGA